MILFAFPGGRFPFTSSVASWTGKEILQWGHIGFFLVDALRLWRLGQMFLFFFFFCEAIKSDESLACPTLICSLTCVISLIEMAHFLYHVYCTWLIVSNVSSFMSGRF